MAKGKVQMANGTRDAHRAAKANQKAKGKK
jgi:hypothetical protein